MIFLIVEDDENKGEQITRFLEEAYPSAALTLVRSLQSAVRYVKRNRPTLIVLDMTLPNYDASPDEPGGGNVHSFGGQEFLRQMDRFEIDVPVVVFTQFETFGKPPQKMGLTELDEKLRSEHPSVYMGSVYYHASIQSWEEHLKSIIDSILATGI